MKKSIFILIFLICFLSFSSIVHAFSLKNLVLLDIISNFFNQVSKIFGAIPFTTSETSNNHLFYVVYHDVLVDSSGKPNTNANRIANAHPVYIHTYARVSGDRVNIPQEVRDLMHNNGVKILCYVKSAPPDSSSPPFSDSQIRSEIADGINLGCDGIMFDNVRSRFTTYYDVYKGWRDYVKTWGSDKIAWFNTGHSGMDESIMEVADIVEVEHHIDDLVQDSPWVTKYPSTRFAANVLSWEDLNYYPLPSGIITSDPANKVTLEKAIQYTNNCWDAGHIAYMYSGNIKNSIGWLSTWFEDYVRGISPQTPTTTTSKTTTTAGSTTTSTTIPKTSTTTPHTTTGSTTTTIPSFIVTNFACNSIFNGWGCKFDYTNNLGENAVLVFYFSDSTSGEIKSAAAPWANTGSGKAGSNLYCNMVPTGIYYVSWHTYRVSDSTLSNPVNWSKNNEKQVIAC